MKSIASRLPFHGKRPICLELRSSTWFVTATVSTGIFTDIFLYAVIVPVFPFSLVERLNIPPDEVQHWLSILLSVYGASLLVMSPICGYFADKLTYRQGPLLVGLVVIAAATILLCLATSLPMLIVGRILQGSSAAVIWVVGLALLGDTVGAEHAAQAIGYVGMAYSLATLLAPLLGGVVYDKGGYYQVFGMAFGMIAFDIVLRLLLIEKKAAKKWFPDEPEVSLADRQEARSDIPMAPSDEQQAVPTPAQLERAQSRNSLHKRLPITQLIRSRRMQTAFFGNIVVAMVMTAFDTTLPLFVSETFHWDSIGGGIIFLAPLAPSFLGPIYGYFVDRYGPRWIAALGFTLSVPFWVLLRLVDHNTLGQKVLLCAFLAMIGIGTALVLTVLMAEFTKICAEKEKRSPGSMGSGGAYAQANGLLNVSWAAGSMISGFWSGGIKQAAGWGTMTWTFALLCGLMVLPVMLFTGGWIGNRHKHNTDG